MDLNNQAAENSNNENTPVGNSETEMTEENINLTQENANVGNEVLEEDSQQEIPSLQSYSETTYQASEIQPEKKKFILQKPIIIALSIFICALLAFGVYRLFFFSSIEGVWAFKYSDDLTLYYTFEDGKAKMTYGTVDFVDTYTLEQDENGNNIFIISSSAGGPLAYYSPISGSYTVSLSGSSLFGQSMTLTSTSSEEVVQELTSGKIPQDILKPDEDFVADEKLIGTWEYVMEDYGISMSYTFNEDGTILINQYDQMIYNGIYNITDKVTSMDASGNEVTTSGSGVEITYYVSEEFTDTIPYEFSGDTLVIGGVGYTKVN